ncbi:MAG TPA: hypothetical protein VMB50_14225 [Myxococcales bacterium]|nr:hypothetical protein [Myxococcales bacterium]
MERCIRTVLFAVAAALAAVACTGCSNNTGGCSATCPEGCTISPDCSTCTPNSPDVSDGLACQTDNDCCTGTCVNGACSAVSTGGGDGGTAGTTSGGSSTGGSGGGNNAVGLPCNTDSDCSSDYCKGPDGGAKVCACNKGGSGYSCKQPTDCCSGSTCVSGVCDLAGTTGGGSTGGSAGSTGGSTSGGTSGCHTSPAPSSTADATCNPDGGTSEICNNQTGICQANCNTQSSSFCATGSYCATNGHCTPTGGSTGGTAASTSGGSTGGGTTGGGTTGGGSTTGGACAAIDSSEFQQCDAGVTCGAGLTCITDPVFQLPLCEYTCTTTANCPDLITACSSGSCGYNFCGVNLSDGGVIASAFGQACNAVGTNDGTCIAGFDSSGAFVGYGVCTQGGSESGSTHAACNASAAARCAGATNLCAGGAICLSPDGGAAGSCYEGCNSSTTCASGTSCQSIDTEEGACEPSTTGGTSSGGSTGGGTGGNCGVSGDPYSTGGGASCGTSPSACCSDYCLSGSCSCNDGQGVDQCASDSDCNPSDSTDGYGSGATCDTSSGTCVNPCATDSDCCSETSNGCVGGVCSATGGGSGGSCGAVGATCSTGTDCCSDYCHRGTCHCNAGGDLYPCQSDADCCAATSTGCGADGFCQ